MQVVVAKSPEKITRFVEVIKSHKFFLFLLLSLLIGILSGALAVKGLGEPFDKLLDDWFRSFIAFRSSAGFWRIFFNCFLTGFIFVTIISLSAFGVSGVIIMPLLIFFRGFGTCILAGILYRNYSLQGIAFADLILLPPCIAADFILLYLSSESMELSKLFCDCLRDVSARGIVLRPNCIVFLKKILWCVISFILASLAEAAFTACFIKYFNFV